MYYCRLYFTLFVSLFLLQGSITGQTEFELATKAFAAKKYKKAIKFIEPHAFHPDIDVPSLGLLAHSYVMLQNKEKGLEYFKIVKDQSQLSEEQLEIYGKLLLEGKAYQESLAVFSNLGIYNEELSNHYINQCKQGLMNTGQNSVAADQILEDQPKFITGVVQDELGNLLPEASVEVGSFAGNGIITSMTNQSGAFFLPFDQTYQTARIHLQGFESQKISISKEMIEKGNLGLHIMKRMQPGSVIAQKEVVQDHQNSATLGKEASISTSTLKEEQEQKSEISISTVNESPVETMSTTNPISAKPRKSFAVQLGSYRKGAPTLERFGSLRDLGSIYTVEVGNMQKVRLGLFTDKDKANFYLKTVLRRGFEGSFIVKEDANGLIDVVKLHMTEKRFTANKYQNNEDEKGSPRVIPNYKIRLASYKDPNWFKIENFSQTKYGTYLEQVVRGDKTIFYLSGFVGKFSASEVLTEVKKLGFKDAYIVEDRDGEEKRIRI